MKIYRIEHADLGTGPYALRHEFWFPQDLSCELGEHSNHNGHPTPWAEAMVGTGSSHYYGFASLEDMYSWFGVDVVARLVDECEFCIVTYWADASEVQQRDHQVAFIKARAAKLEVVMSLPEELCCLV